MNSKPYDMDITTRIAFKALGQADKNIRAIKAKLASF